MTIQDTNEPDKVWDENERLVTRPKLDKLEKHFKLLTCVTHGIKEPCDLCLKDAQDLFSKQSTTPIYFTGKPALKINFDPNRLSLPDLSGLDLKDRDVERYQRIVKIAKGSYVF